MKHILLFKRKLFFVVFFVLFATSAFCIEVDLKLNEKPPHIPAYQWCKMRANLLVKEKLVAVLACLQMSMEQLSEEVKNFRKNMDDVPYSPHIEISDRIAKCVFDFFSNPNVRKEIGLINITRKNCEIIIETERVGVIKIIEGFFNGTCSNKKYHVLKLADDGESNEEIKETIGHEIAHILNDDNILRRAIVDNISSCYSPSFLELCRAKEVRADIVGTFGNKSWAKAGEKYFQKLSYDGEEDGFMHPSSSKREAYLGQMVKYF